MRQYGTGKLGNGEPPHSCKLARGNSDQSSEVGRVRATQSGAWARGLFDDCRLMIGSRAKFSKFISCRSLLKA